YIHFIFLYQSEDAILNDLVTGVQTCALPILQQAGITDRKMCDYVGSLLETFSQANRLLPPDNIDPPSVAAATYGAASTRCRQYKIGRAEGRERVEDGRQVG